MKLPLPFSKNVIILPPIFHPNLLEKVRIGERNYFIKGPYSGDWDINSQREGLRACLSKAFNIGVGKFFEFSNSGFFYGYPSKDGGKEVDFSKAPKFSRLCWYPFHKKELLFILRALEEREKGLIFNIKGRAGVGKSWIIRRVVDFSPDGILLNGRWGNLEKIARDILREGGWRVIGIENFGEGNSFEVFKVLYLSLPKAIFLLEGKFEEGYELQIFPPEYSEWETKLIALDEETKDTALSILKNNPSPGFLISSLVRGKEIKKGGATRRREKEKTPHEREIELLEDREKEEALKTSSLLNGKKTKVMRAKSYLALGKRERALEEIASCQARPCKAIKAFLQREKFEVKDNDGEETLLWAARGEETRGNFLLAEAIYRKAYSKALSSFDGLTTGKIASDIGAFFFRRGNIEEAEKYFRNSLWLLSSMKSSKTYTLSSYNLAEVLFLKGSWTEAERLYRRSYNEGLGSPNSLSHAYDCSSLGYLLYLKGDFEKGKALLEEALNILIERGNIEAISDISFKVFDFALETGEVPEKLLNANLPPPSSRLRDYFLGKEFQGEGPWELFLNGLRLRRKKFMLRAAQKFSSQKKEYEENLCYYFIAKEGLWGRKDEGKLRKAMKWYRKRGSYRAKVIESLIGEKEQARGEKITPGDEEGVFSQAFSLSLESIPGEERGFFIVDEDNTILYKKSTSGVPWLLIRNYSSPKVILEASSIEDEELRKEIFLKGINSFMISGNKFGKGEIIGFFGSSRSYSYTEDDLSELETLLESAASSIKFNEGFLFLKGASWGMRKVFSQIKRAAENSMPVLISGETGTGKELVVKSIHKLSGKGNLIAVNCAAIPESLLESELFGYRAGAFTDAKKDKKGLIEDAYGGILFLDEIGEMSLSLQAKLLRVIQERKVRRLGDNIEREVEFKLISATNRDLFELVKEGKFRKDLYYRISLLKIELPALRERKEDIIPLSLHFAEREAGRKIEISRKAKDILLSYEWHGNVRELEGTIKRAVAFMEEGEFLIVPQHLPSYMRTAERSKGTLEEARGKWERDFILSSFEANGQEISRTAEELGITRQHLYNLMKRYGIR